MYTAYERLLSKLDDTIARIEKLHSNYLVCRIGCADCCNHILTFYRVEIDAIIEYLGSLEESEREQIIKRLEEFRDSNKQNPCPMLENGRCLIYTARPLLCRSHGLLFNMSEVPGSLDIEKSCDLNYSGVKLCEIPSSEALNQKLLSMLLIQVNALYCAEKGSDPNRRYKLTELTDLIIERVL